jgi:hypothetical protein
MQYVLIDPFLLYLPEPRLLTREEAEGYLQALHGWSKALERCENRITFSISEKCSKALAQSSGYPEPSQVRLRDLLEFHNIPLDSRDFLASCRRFFESLWANREMVERIEEARRSMDWQFERLGVRPEQIVARLQPLDSNLAQAFQETLAEVAFARKNSILPISALSEISIGSRDVDETLEAEIESYCVHQAGEDLEERTEQIKDTFRVITHDQIEQTEPSFRNFLEAIAWVEGNYPRHIVISERAKRLASEAPRDIEPRELKELLEKLVTVWLSAYEAGGGDHDEKYRAATRRHCALDESETARNRFASDYTVSFEGEDVFCGRHIKIGHRFRINFQVVRAVNGINKILVARIGKHGRNTLS